MDYEGSRDFAPDTDGAQLITEVSAAAAASAKAGAAAVPLVPDLNNVVVLPQGTELDDIKVIGRDLVITLNDGRSFIIADGAVFVPEIVINGVSVPPLNLAALLTSNGPQPAAGLVSSSGGNFTESVDPLQAAYNLGDLLPYTELTFTSGPNREVIPSVDQEPTVFIVTPDQQVGAVSATSSVNEAGLPARGAEPAGSNSAANSETVTGSIVFEAADGLASISLNGVAITAQGQTIATAHGIVTITSLTPGNYGYSYTLTDNTSGDSTTDAVAVAVVDLDGDIANATLTIRVIDDVATARNDADTVPAATYVAETGNVLTGSGTTSGTAGADTLGADGAAISGFRVGTSGSFSTVGTTISGLYGTLTLNANGSYSYTRSGNTPGGVNDVFSYQLTDGDGDTSTATLTISITDSPNRIDFVPTVGDAVDVHEPHLPARGSEPAGSEFDGDLETAIGAISFTSPDGLASTTINGVVINPGALPQQVVSNATGTLTITGFAFNSATGSGTITYVYLLNDNTLGTNGTTITFPITVTDLDGDVAPGVLAINVVDDAPVAANDADAIAAGSYLPATGNVITDGELDGGKDSPGADGSIVTAVSGASAGTVGGTTAGAYGVLTINADGGYSYARNPGSPGGVSDVFTYTITDNDGDPATATLTIAIADSGTSLDLPTGEEAGTLVFESGLPAGSNAASNSETTTGTINYVAPDGPATVTIDGIAVTSSGQTFVGSFGILTIADISSGAIAYSYTLTTNTSGNATFDDFAVVVTDKDGDSTPGTLVISIVDDAPSAVDDAARSVAEDAVGTIGGNVMGNDTAGADSAVMTSAVVNGVTVAVAAVGTTNYSNAQGAYTFTAAGAWTFNPASGLGNASPVDASFSYTITDGDGDPSSAVQPISVTDGANPVGGDAASLSVDDQNLADGSSPAAPVTASDTITFTAGSDPISTIVFSSDLSGLDASLSWTRTATQIVGKAGAATIVTLDLVRSGDSATVTLTLNDNYALHTGINTDDLKTLGAVQIIATDSDGDTATGTVNLAVSDDLPVARADVDSVTEDTALTADGNVITASGGSDANASDGVADTKGADGTVVTAVSFGATPGTVDGTTAGTYGTLTLNANGSYSYALNNAHPAAQGLDGNDTLTEVFTYTLTDGDNDTSTTTLTVTINGSNDPVTINGLSVEGPDLIVDEDDLGDGSDLAPKDPLVRSGSFTVDGLDGIAAVKVAGSDVATGLTFSTAHGAFTITSVSAPVDGNATSITIGYSYTLTDNTAHANAGGENFLTETFGVVVTDTDGSTASDTIEVRIVDDVPSAADDLANQTAENAAVVINAFGNDVFGADGVDTDNNPLTVVTFTQPATGAVAYNAGTGLFTFTQVPGQTGSTSFTYTIQDGDGDTSTATVTINLLSDSIPTVTVTDTTVNEDGLPARGLEAAGSASGSGSHIGTGSFTIGTGSDTLQMLEVQDKNGAWINVTAGGTVTGNNGTLVVTLSAGTYSYTYTLGDNLATHPDTIIDGDGLSDAADPLAGEAFAVRATDSDGSVSLSDTLDVTVLDDAPSAVDDAARSVAEDAVGTIGGNVMGNDTAGADSAVMTSAVVNGVTVAVAAVGTTNYSNAQGAYTFTAAGAWTFNPASGLGNASPVDASFSYTITDGDGDPSSAVQPISVTDGANPVGGDAASLSVDDQNLADGSSPAAPVTASDTITFTAGSDPISTIVFSSDLSGLDASLSWTRTATQIVGKAGAATIVTLDLVRSGDSATVTLTLNDNYALHTGINTDDLKTLGAVQIIATDSDGDTATGTVNLAVSDDLPVARADVDSVTEDTALTADGNVITASGGSDANASDGVADTKGADGTVVTAVSFGATPGTVDGTTAGTYGTLTLNANGSYSYALNNAHPAVQGLDGNDTLTEVFTYTLTDGDNDTSTTTLTVTINGSNDPVTINGLSVEGPDLIVDEDDLGDGSDLAPKDPLVRSGSFTVDGLDGIAAVKVAGSDVATGLTFSTAHGAFTITSVSAPVDGNATSITIGYSYTLTDNTAHANAGGENFLTETFGVVVTDTDGSTASDTIEVRIVDDVPSAADDLANQTAENAAVVINAFGNDVFGADGVDTDNNPLTVVTFTQPATGAVAYNAGTGLFTFTQVPGQTGSTSFTYTIQDGDGDTSTATVTINLLSDSIPTVTVTDTTVNEDGLPARGLEAAGSASGSGSHIGTGSFTIGTGSDTLQMLEVQDKNGAWINVTAGGTVTGNNGTLVVTLSAGTYSYTYTLGDNLATHPDTIIDGDGLSDAADPLAGEAFAVRATDSDGSVSLSDTLDVTVLDDAPSAVDDAARSVAEDAVGTIGGNVMGNDTAGADSAVMTSAVVNGVTVAVAAVGTTNYSNAQGAYTFTAAGAWTFNPASGLGNASPVDASFSYTITDGDGDPSSAVQPISVTDGANPVGGDAASLSVDDQNLADGSSPAAPVTASDTITFTAGSDPISTIVFSSDLSGLDASLSWTRTATQIVGKAGAATIVTLDLVRSGDSATVTLTLNDNYALHTGINTDDLKTLGAVQIIATDSDGDTATGTVNLAVSDDLPTVTGVAPANADLSVDESNLLANDSASFSGLFTPHFNADGAAAIDPIVYALGVSAPGAISGLIDVATGNQILLRVVGGVVEGYLAGSPAVVAFTLTVDTSGNATLDQIRALQHSVTSDHNDPVGLSSAALVTLTATVTDSDGDTSSALINIGNALEFRDDGPGIVAAAVDPATVLATQDAETDGSPTNEDTSSADFSTAFSALSASYGADDSGTTTWTYSVGLKVSSGTSSGLTSDGQPITLHMNGTVAEGRVGATVIFSISVNVTSGQLTLTQYAEIDHAVEATTTAPFDDQFTALANSLVELVGTVTIVDRDGDSVTDSAAIDLGGNIRFYDDGPIAVADTNSVVEGGIVSGNVLLDGVDDAFGADGPATTVPAGGVVGVATGSSTANPVSGGVGLPITTALGTLTLNADGTYSYDAKPNTTAATITDTFVYTIQDGDGDTSTTTLTITITPVTLAADNDTVTVNEAALDTLVTGLDVAAGTITGSNPALTSETATGTLSVPGAVSFALSGSCVGTYGTLVLNSGTGGYTYTLRNPFDTTPDNNNGVTTEASAEAFTYTATDADGNTVTGTITVDIIDDTPSVSAAINALASVTVDESGPNLAATLDTGTVVKGDDPDLAGSNALARSSSGSAIVTDTVNFGADVAAASGSKVYSLSAVNGAGSGLTLTDGTGINLQLLPNGNVVGVVATGLLAGQAAFAVAIDTATGIVTVEQYLSLAHPNTGNPDDAVQMVAGAISAIITVKDGDGDITASSAVDITGKISFEDDGPSITVDTTATTVLVDETNLAAGVAAINLGTFTQGADADKGVGVTVTASAATVMSATTSSNGVDGAGTPNVTYALGLAGGASTAASLLTTTDGTAITLVKVSDTVVVGKVGATNTVAFAIELDASSGTVKVEQYLSLNHPDSLDPNDPISLAAGDLSIIGTVKDGDGDTTSDPATIGDRIVFGDDGPSAVAPASISVTNAASAPVTASLDPDTSNNYGADGGTVRFLPSLNGADSGLKSAFVSIIYTVVDDHTLVGKAGATTIFTITLDPLTSQYTVDMNGKVDATTTIDFNSGAYDFLGGNNSWAGFIPLAETVAVPIDNNSQDLLLTPAINGLPDGTAKTTANIGGVDSGASVGANETFRVDFVTDLSGDTHDGAGNYNTLANRDHVFDGHYTVNGASALFVATTNSTVKITAFDDPDGDTVVGDGTKDSISSLSIAYLGVAGPIIIPTTTPTNYTVNGQVYTVTLNGDGSVTVGGIAGDTGSSLVGTVIAVFTSTGYNSVEYTWQGGDTFQIGDFGATVLTETAVSFTVPVEVVDGDGDVSTSSNLSITANPAVPPIAIDLNGDGVNYLALSAGVTHDYGSGVVATAWVAADDGLLAHQTSDGLDIVFGGNGLTDLEGLAATFDSNHDGQLNSLDTQFAEFGVWQDANSNGVSETGEYKSLTAMGIASIGLTSDGESYLAADGDVAVNGTGVYTLANGGTGLFADAVFAIDRQAREATSASNAAVIAAATALLVDTSVLAAMSSAVAPAGDNAVVIKTASNMVSAEEFARHVEDSPSSLLDRSSGSEVHEPAPVESHQLEQSVPSQLIAFAAAGSDITAPAPDEPGSAMASGFRPMFFESGMQAMDALLTMPANAPAISANDAHMATMVVANALGDLRAEAFVDHLLSNLGTGGDADGFAQHAMAQGSQIISMLAMDIDGGVAMFHQFDPSQTADDHAALAAANS